MRMVSLTIPLAESNPQSGIIKAKKKFTCGITFDLASDVAFSSAKMKGEKHVFLRFFHKY